MLMFRIISIVLFLLLLIGFIFIIKNKKRFWSNFLTFIRDTVDVTRKGKNTKPTTIFMAIKLLVYWIVLLCVVLMAVSGFYYPILFGSSPAGILLLIHVTVAPIFAIAVAALGLLWAHNHGFNRSDWDWLQYKLKSKRSITKKNNSNFSAGQKLCFWLGLTFSLPVILSIVLSMFPYFGTYGQQYLLQIHRYGAIILVVILTFHSYLLISQKN